jgi:hypothetical protein
MNIYGQPTTHLTPYWYATGDRLVHWIKQEIPCFVGDVPVEYWRGLCALFQKHNVPHAIIREAMLKLEKNGIRFEGANGNGSRGGATPLPQVKDNRDYPRPPVMGQGPVTKSEKGRFNQRAFEEYEFRYVLAINTNDVAGAEAILVAVLTLLCEWAKGYAKTRQAKNHEKVKEGEEFTAAVNEALERATMLKTHIRYLSREQVRELRAATPEQVPSVALRFARPLILKEFQRAPRPRKQGVIADPCKRLASNKSR